MRPILGIAITAALLAMTGCTSAERINAETPAGLKKSLDRYVSSQELDLSRQQRRQIANYVDAAYLQEGEFKPEQEGEGARPVGLLHRLRFEDLRSFVGKLGYSENPDEVSQEDTQQTFDDDEQDVVRHWRNQYLKRQLEVQRDLLIARKEQSRYADLFTIDQLKFMEASFIPPQDNQPIGEDKARFTVTFQNGTAFNLYRPGFHIRIDDPRKAFPVLDVVLKHDSEEPIYPGSSEPLTLSCCDSFNNKSLNDLLRDLPADANIAMHLVSVEDYGKKNLIANSLFTADQHLKLVATEACLKEMNADLDQWVYREGGSRCNGI